MKLALLSLKSAVVKFHRSITLGFFIFIVAFVMLVASAFISAARKKVENVIVDGFTGHIQIRSGGSREGDMVTQYSQGWDALKSIDAKTVHTIDGILAQYSGTDITHLCRRSAYLEAGDTKQETMLIGLSPDMERFRQAFSLSEGRYPDQGGANEILLTKEQSTLLGLGVGDYVKVTTKNQYGLRSEMELEVVGIGDFIMLSLFSYNANYTQFGVVQKLAGYKDGEATDILLYLPDNRNMGTIVKELSGAFDKIGLEYSVTAEDKLTSEDLQVSEIDFDSDTDEGVMLSSADEMGESFKAVTGTMFVVLNILVVFLMIIVSVLIFNLVYMTGIERYREIGTFRAIGFSKAQVIRIFMGEIMSVSISAIILGILASSLLVILLNRSGVTSPLPFLTYIMGETLHLEPDPVQSLTNVLIILLFSIVSSFLPAYRACSVDPAEAIRTV